jgi:hypothetical protein
MKRKGATQDDFDKLVFSMPRNMGAMVEEFTHNKQRYERDAANNRQEGLAASSNAELAKNPAAGLDALKVSVEQLAASIAGPTVQAFAPALAGMAQKVQNASATIGALNPNLVAMGGGVAAVAGTAGALKALFGAGGSMFSGLGLGKSALALDGSAEALTRAAVAIGGKGVAEDAALAAGGAGMLARAMAWLQNSPALAASSLLYGNASGNKGVADMLRSQHPDWSPDDMKNWAREQLDPLAPGYEIRRPVAHPGRDVRSPSSGPYSYTPAEAQVSVDTHAVDAAAAKIDALGHARPTVVIGVDTSAVDAAVSRIRSAAASVGAAVHGMPPSLGSTQRGNFSFGGISGE